MPVVAPPGDICGIPGDEGIRDFFADAKTLFPTWSDTLTLESVYQLFWKCLIEIKNRGRGIECAANTHDDLLFAVSFEPTRLDVIMGIGIPVAAMGGLKELRN